MEIQILNAIQNIHTSWLDACMIGITKLGNHGLIWFGLTLVLLIIPKTRKIGIMCTLALIIDLIGCNLVLKHFFARPRPYMVNPNVHLLIPEVGDHSSFPSGHTAMAFTIASVFYLNKFKGWQIIGIFAILIAFSRLYLYVHFPTDVLAGILIGIGCGILGVRIYQSKRQTN